MRRAWTRLPLLLGSVVAFLLAVPGWAETITYVLTPQTRDGGIDVELTWETEGRTASALAVAEHWGSTRNIPRLIQNVKISGGQLDERDETTWKLRHAKNATVQCRYRVLTGKKAFDWPTLHLPITAARFFHGVGATFLLAPQPGHGGAPAEYDAVIRWRLPTDWKAACSLGTGKSIGGRMAIDDLRHAVYLAGPLVTKTVKIPAADELTVALVPEFDFSVDELTELVSGIIDEQCKFMHETQFPPFVVTAIPVGAEMKGGQSLSGTGLYHSFALFLPPKAGLTEGVDHLLAHELFHHWNGRIMQREEPEELTYWFSEGFTDYYALRILRESDRWSAATLAKWINRHLREYAANPAQHATNAQIQAGFWKERDTVGEVAYQRGLLVALRWHRLARDRGVTEGLDRLMLKLVERGRAGDKLSNAAIRKLGQQALGDWFAAEFDRYIERAETVAVPPDALRPELVGEISPVYAFELGFDRERSTKEKRVVDLVPGSAAAEAGLKEGEELAGWSIFADADKEVRLQVKRNGQVETVTYLPRGKKSEVLQFKPAE